MSTGKTNNQHKLEFYITSKINAEIVVKQSGIEVKILKISAGDNIKLTID